MNNCQPEHHQGQAKAVFLPDQGFHIKVLNLSEVWRFAKLNVKGKPHLNTGDVVLAIVVCYVQKWEERHTKSPLQTN